MLCSQFYILNKFSKVFHFTKKKKYNILSFLARVTTFNIPQLPAPPVPPDNIVTEQDRHVQLQYEQWLNHQHQLLTQQLKYYETEVQKLRKVRKVSHGFCVCLAIVS